MNGREGHQRGDPLCLGSAGRRDGGRVSPPGPRSCRLDCGYTVAVPLPCASQCAAPCRRSLARTAAWTPQMLAAIPTGTWIVLFVTARFTSPFCWVVPPGPGAGARAGAPAPPAPGAGPPRGGGGRGGARGPPTLAATPIGGC